MLLVAEKAGLSKKRFCRLFVKPHAAMYSEFNKAAATEKKLD